MDSKKQKKQLSNSEEVKKLKEELDTAKSQYLRALADYHNLEKRISEAREETVKAATKRIVVRLLPFLDNVEKAEIFIKDAGLGMIKNQFSKILQDEGVVELEVLNKPFDPETAEVVEVIPGQKDNVVAEVIQKGFALEGKVIRPAQVKVTKKV